jgi:hypothetical protein
MAHAVTGMVRVRFVISLVVSVLPAVCVVARLMFAGSFSVRLLPHVVMGVLFMLRMRLTLVVLLVFVMFHIILFHSAPLRTCFPTIRRPGRWSLWPGVAPRNYPLANQGSDCR